MQIFDYIGDMILRGEIVPDGSLPSVRELAVTLEVNPNTVMRAVERLLMAEVIYNKRGMGNYLQADAYEKIKQIRLQRLITEQIPRLADEIALLRVSSEQIKELLDDQLRQKDRKG